LKEYDMIRLMISCLAGLGAFVAAIHWGATTPQTGMFLGFMAFCLTLSTSK